MPTYTQRSLGRPSHDGRRPAAARLRHIATAVTAAAAGGTKPPDASPDEILAAHYASVPHVAAQLQKRPAGPSRSSAGGGGTPALRAGSTEPACLDYAYSFIANPGPLNAVRLCECPACAL